ncbi:MAG: SNF2-related protein, partial [Candidatus Baltobacteraceae bacterium]
MSPFATWRSRLPATVGSWFARELVARGLALFAQGRVALRIVEDARIDATVAEPPASEQTVGIEWAGGTGPLALRAVCSCGGSGICAHIVAVLEAVRSQTEVDDPQDTSDDDVGWLPSVRSGLQQARARCVWIVFSATENRGLGATLVLDSPRLRGAVRDAGAILAMMEATPSDDWDDADRELVRDELVQDAFAGRPAPKALARALFRAARHPRIVYDDQPNAGRHPSGLAELAIDLRGLRLRATLNGAGFVPIFESFDAVRFSPRNAALLEGPPTWLGDERAIYLLDGSFDARRVLEAARAADEHAGGPVRSRPSARTILRVAPYLTRDERETLGVVDAADPTAEVALGWSMGALVASLTFADRVSGVRAPYAAVGATAAHGDGYVRFGPEVANDLRARLLEVGFVPRGGDGFALHGADRAAAFVRDVLPTWSDLALRLDPGLVDLTRGEAGLEIAVSAVRSGERTEWFDLQVDVFVGTGREALTPRELEALLAGSGRYADVRGKLVDVAKLRERGALLSDLAQTRRTGFAALLALRDELHDNFANVALPEEVERLRERLRDFGGIETVEPPALTNGALRGYQQRGLDFLSYLASFEFGGVLADDMGLGKTVQVVSHLLRRKLLEGPAPSLVIAPTSVTHTWENEIARFAPELRTLRLASGSERATKYDAIAEADVVITSYALARLDAALLAEHEFRTLILDEAQNAKNPSSQIARVVRALRAKHRLALTGTPVENSLRDLWAIFAFVEPGLLGSEGSFRRRFELPIAEGDERATEILRSRLEPFVLRRTKEDVAPELPERTEVVLECDLSPLQRRLYRGVAEAARRDVLAQFDT